MRHRYAWCLAALLTVSIVGCGAQSATGLDQQGLAVGDVASASGRESAAPTATPRGTRSPRPTKRATPAAEPTITPTPAPPPVTPTPALTPTPAPRGPVLPAGSITAIQGAGRVGQYATVCGIGYTTALSSGQTFVNLDAPYPDHSFTLLIWPEDRHRYAGAPEDLFAGRLACAAGVISSYDGVAQIVARDNMVWSP